VVSQAVYVAAVLCSAGVALAVAVWLWDDDLGLAGKLFVGIAVVEAATGLLVVAELFAPTRSLATLIYGVHTGVAGAVPILTFLFVVAYLGLRRWLTRRVLAASQGRGACLRACCSPSAFWASASPRRRLLRPTPHLLRRNTGSSWTTGPPHRPRRRKHAGHSSSLPPT